jgi:hypothetical protein
MSIDLACDWTDADSEWLDRLAARRGITTPLTPDPALYAALADDRAAAPRTRSSGAPTHCASCCRPLRSSRTPPDEAPGTVIDHGRGRCRRCHPGRGRAGATATPRLRSATPTHCRDCERPLRPGGTRVVDHPNTVAHEGRGLCVTCTRKAKKK